MGNLGNCPAHSEPSLNISYLLSSSIIIIIIMMYLSINLVTYSILVPMPTLCFTPNALICTPWKWFLLFWPYILEFMPFLTLGTLCLLPPLQFPYRNPIFHLSRLIKLPSPPWKLSSLHHPWAISAALCTTLYDLYLGTLYSCFFKARQISYSKFYSLQFLYNILHYTMLKTYLPVEWIA